MRYDINKECYELNHSKSTNSFYFQAEDTPVYELIIIHSYCRILFDSHYKQFYNILRALLLQLKLMFKTTTTTKLLVS